MQKIPQLRDVNSDQQNAGLSANVTIDRSTAARMGITPQTIDNILYDAFGEREIATTYTSLNQYFVVMEVDPVFWQNPNGLREIYATTVNGGQVPLAAFTSFQDRDGGAGGESLRRIPVRDHLIQPGSRASR